MCMHFIVPVDFYTLNMENKVLMGGTECFLPQNSC